MRIRQVGASALLLETEPADVMAWYSELIRRREAGELQVVEMVPAARTVLLDGVPDPAALSALLPVWAPTSGPGALSGSAPGPSGAVMAADPGRLVEIPVGYGGADLADVAELWGTTERGVIDRLGGIEFRVAFCGFSPGFGYLTGLPPELAVARLPSPRPRVPAGSVALAGRYAGIYPSASPGGWRLVGHTDVQLFNVDADPPALLAPGRRVRLVPA